MTESEAEKLRRATADLQEFTLHVCHDLREPLRTVNSYCELISRLEGCSSADAQLFRRYISEGVEKIESLLNGMLEYASVEPQTVYLMSTDMNEVFEEAVRYASAGSNFGNAALTHDPLPSVNGDFDRLVKVMRHLFENSVKFSGRSDPQIHVSANMDSAGWLIAVRDNGIGIAPAHHRQIFDAFKRLHGKEYPGNGLGLAFCKKVIEWHGGRIWVESQPGEGATFCFTLPAAD